MNYCLHVNYYYRQKTINNSTKAFLFALQRMLCGNNSINEPNLGHKSIGHG